MGKNLFRGSLSLLSFHLRRDRLYLPIWILGLSFFFIGLVPVFDQIILTGTDGVVMAEMMKNPAMVAIVGPVYGASNYHLGASYGNMMFLFSVMLTATMSIFIISRHTRSDEEKGRLELIRALPVGRLATLSSAILVSFIANLFIGLLTAIGIILIGAEGMSTQGAIVFGAGLFVTGMVFTGITAIMCQLFQSNGGALGSSLFLLFILYMMRAVGDVGNETLSLLSPLGLILRVENFVQDHWWPIIMMLGISVVLIILSYILVNVRDVDSGFIPERGGRAHGSFLLGSPFGLAFRLTRFSTIIWAITLFSFAGMYGSVFGDLEGFLNSNEMLRAIFTGHTGFSLVEQFIGLLMIVMSCLSTIPGLLLMNRNASEELRGRVDLILSKSVSRRAQILYYLFLALIYSVLFQLLIALGFWIVGSQVLETSPPLETFMISAFSYLPAIWSMIALALLIQSIFPRRAFLSYLYLAYSFMAMYIGRIIKAPDWTRQITAYHYIPEYPLEKMEATNLVILSLIALGMITVGVFLYERRDLIKSE